MYAKLDQALMSESPGDALQRLVDDGEMLPEIMQIVGFGGDGHKDLWKHTKIVVGQAYPKREIRWGALFHDLGKPACFRRDGKKVSFHGHEAVSAQIFNQAARRIKMDGALRKHIHFLVLHLGLVESYLPDWTDSAVRRLGNQLGDYLEDISLLSRADITTANSKRRERKYAQLDEFQARVLALRAEDLKPTPLPKGLGDALSAALEIPPSKRLGNLMQALKRAVEAGELPVQGSFDVYIEYAFKTLIVPQ